MAAVVKPCSADLSDSPQNDSVEECAHLVIMAALAAAGLVIRLPLLNQPLTIDEIGQVVAARAPLPDLFLAVRGHAAAAPLDYLGTKLVVWIPELTIGPHLWPLLLGVAAIPLAWRASRALFHDDLAAILTAAGVAFAPFLVTYSAVTRFYSLIVVVALVSVWAFARLVDDPSLRRRWAGWGASIVLVFYTHYPLLGLAALEVAVLALRHRDQWRPLISTIGVATVACLPWALFALPTQLAMEYAAYPRPALDAALVRDTLSTLLSGPRVVIGTLALAALGVWAARSRPILPVLAWTVLVIPATWLAEAGSGFYSDPRHVIVTVPLILLLAGAGLAYLARRSSLVGVVAGIFVVVALLPGLRSAIIAPPNYNDWRAASAWLRDQVSSDASIGSTLPSPWAYGIGYYAPELMPRMVWLESVDADLAGRGAIVDAGYSLGLRFPIPSGWDVRSFGPWLRMAIAPETMRR